MVEMDQVPIAQGIGGFEEFPERVDACPRHLDHIVFASATGVVLVGPLVGFLVQADVGRDGFELFFGFLGLVVLGILFRASDNTLDCDLE
jgi:hypothetical protein